MKIYEKDKNELFILQCSFLSTILLFQMNNQCKNFLESDMFNTIKFTLDQNSNNIFHTYIKKIGIINQGSLLMILYVLFVLPKESFFKKSKEDFDDLNKEIDKYVTKKQSNYDYDNKIINYTKHLRNAIAHVSVDYSCDGKNITIRDENPRKKDNNGNKYTCKFTISKDNLSLIIDYSMKHVFMKNLWNSI